MAAAESKLSGRPSNPVQTQVPLRCEKVVASAPAYNYAPPPTLGRINEEFSLAIVHAEYARAGVLEKGGVSTS